MIEININPIAFFGVRWYGVMVALAITVLVLWVLWQVKKGAKITPDTVLMAAVVGIPSGVVISRLLHVIDNIVVAKLHPELALTGQVIDYLQYPGQIIGGSGLTIWGAVIGAGLGIWAFSKFSKSNFSYLADLIAPGLILAQIVGRIGCTINGCCYGSECDLPWAVVYMHPESLAPHGIAVHPTQVYEIIYLIIMFIISLSIRSKLKSDGLLFLVYLAMYSLWRLGIDFIRDGNPFLFGLHQAQVIAIITLVVTIPMIVLRARRVKVGEEVEEEMPLSLEEKDDENEVNKEVEE
ncbi:prolipoprotein diacylglyceryl transferase [Chloroflexota bacterium]